MGQVDKERRFLRNMLFDDWSNDACCGYTLIALKNLQVPDELIGQVLKELKYIFSDIEVSEAQEIFRNYGN